MTLAHVPAGISRRTVRLIQGLMVMSVLVPIVGIGLVIWQDRDAVLQAAERHVEESVDVLHEHTLKVFEIHNLLLDKVAMRTDGLDWATLGDSPAIAEFLAGTVAHMSYVRTVWLIDRDGRVRVTSTPSQQIAGFTVEDREYFRAERDPAATTFISKPYAAQSSHQPLLAIARRRSTADGTFDGVIRISVPVAYFEHLFASMEPDEQHRVALLRADGEVLASDPPPPGEVVRFPQSSLLMQAIASGNRSHRWQVSPMDGREHLFSWRQLGHYPLYVAYAIDKDVALRPWYHHVRLYSVIGLCAAMTLFLISWLALRYTRREQDLVQLAAQEADGRLRAEASLQQVRKLEAVGQLTGGVAHDFNNLLTTILGNAERAQRQTQREKQLQCLRSIERAASNGARLVHHLLAFARKQHLDAQPTDLNETIRQLTEMLESTIGARIRIVTELEPAPWLAIADASQFETAILNVVLNARDAMPSGGRLTISTANVAAADPSRPPDIEPRDYVMVAVSDNGVGMTDDIRARVFEPFFTTKEVGKGSGLGLSQVYGMARQSGGTVTIDSAPDRGTTVRLYVPRATSPRAARAERPARAEDRQVSAAATVLVVDDDFQVRNFVADSLMESGYRTIEAPDGRSALRILDGESIDLAVIDLAMPGMDGRELAKHARQRRKDLPILFMTAYVEGDMIDALKDQPLLMKPFRATALAKEIDDILARVRGTAAAPSRSTH
ncbi:MAG TPA: ATP-binding protein, partial [Stellaceae bacterium]|nr:ATP-binding protein [Stellaceae bacterium]